MKAEKQYKDTPSRIIQSKTINNNFSDNRSSSVCQAMLIADIHDSKKNRSGIQEKPMQFRAMAGFSNLCYRNALFQEPKLVINANAEEKKIIDDPFIRFYKDEEEFHYHVGGRAVECGLIKKLAYWYRLPELMSGKLFVLGEAHNVVGHRTIVEESNHTGREVLTECGALDIKSPDAKISETPSETNVTYQSIESVLSKTLYGLIALQNAENETVQNVRKEEASKWFKHKWFRDIHRNNLNVPYKYSSILSYEKIYLNIDENEDKRTAGGKFSPLHYKEYNLLATANDIVNSCISAIDKYLGVNHDSIDDNNFNSGLDALRSSLVEIRPGDPDFKLKVSLAIPKCMELALAENSALVGSTSKFERLGFESDESPDSEQYKIGKSMHDANSLREAFMFNSICKAKNNGYLLAGIGNEHAESMKKELHDRAEIETITYKDFISHKCKNAY